MEGERQAALLQHGVELHVAIVEHAALMRRRHHEADHAGLVGEILDHLDAGFRLVERKIEHRADARLVRQHLVTEPAVIGARQRHLDIGPRRGGERQHRRREQADDIDPHRVHPALGQRDVAMRHRRHLLLAAPADALDAAAEILEVGVG